MGKGLVRGELARGRFWREIRVRKKKEVEMHLDSLWVCDITYLNARLGFVIWFDVFKYGVTMASNL